MSHWERRRQASCLALLLQPFEFSVVGNFQKNCCRADFSREFDPEAAGPANLYQAGKYLPATYAHLGSIKGGEEGKVKIIMLD